MNKKLITISVCLFLLQNNIQSSGPAIPMVSQGGVQQRRRDLRSRLYVMPDETIVQAIAQSRRRLLMRTRRALILGRRPQRRKIGDEELLRYKHLSSESQKKLF